MQWWVYALVGIPVWGFSVSMVRYLEKRLCGARRCQWRNSKNSGFCDHAYVTGFTYLFGPLVLLFVGPYALIQGVVPLPKLPTRRSWVERRANKAAARHALTMVNMARQQEIADGKLRLAQTLDRVARAKHGSRAYLNGTSYLRR